MRGFYFANTGIKKTWFEKKIQNANRHKHERTKRNCRAQACVACALCFLFSMASGQPHCQCGTLLSRMSRRMLQEWSAFEGERWHWHTATQAYFNFCVPCHLQCWPKDVRSQGPWCRPARPRHHKTPAQTRPQTPQTRPPDQTRPGQAPARPRPRPDQTRPDQASPAQPSPAHH